MKLSNNFSLLKEKKALLIVAGKQVARFFTLSKGKIQEVEDVAVSKERFTDREGAFGERNNSKFMTSATDYERRDDQMIIRFLKAVKESLSKVANSFKYDEIILYAPAGSINHIKEVLNNPEKEKIEYEFEGNYNKHHPEKLLAMIEEVEEKKEQQKNPPNAEASKILQTTKVRKKQGK